MWIEGELAWLAQSFIYKYEDMSSFSITHI